MIKTNEIPHLISVQALPNLKIKLIYADGFSGIYDLKKLTTHEVFKPLLEEKLFKSVTNRKDVVVWNNDMDLCADALFLELTNQTITNA